jgi:hypothetical protein
MSICRNPCNRIGVRFARLNHVQTNALNRQTGHTEDTPKSTRSGPPSWAVRSILLLHANLVCIVGTGIAGSGGLMPEQPSARIFISYSRKDGAEFATRLRTQLQNGQFCIWQDLVALEGGRDWWSQIEDALRSRVLQHLVVVITPAALASPIVRREIRLARQEGKTICPIKGPELGDLGKLPRWLGQIYNLDLPEHWR